MTIFKHPYMRPLLAALLSAFILAGPAAAQQSPPIDVIKRKDKFVDQDEYVEPSMQNLSRLMWTLGANKLSDDKAIDNYLLINECALYQRFFYHDLEWGKIREATREYLNANMASFPTTFEIIVPIQLERYDQNAEIFSLTNDSKMLHLRRLYINSNDRTDICGERGVSLQGYTRDLVLLLNRPFTLEKIPVRRELAALYLEEARQKVENLPAHLRLHIYEREAYLRAKVRVINFKEMIMANREPQAVVYGEMEGIEIYADTKKIKLLFSEDVRKKSMRERRRDQMTGNTGDNTLTFGVDDEEKDIKQ